MAFQLTDNAVAGLLRLATVGVKRQKGLDYSALLRADKIMLTDQVIVAVAKIVEFMGLNHTSATPLLSRAVYEVVKGWEIYTVACSEGEWQAQANRFAGYFNHQSVEPIGIADMYKLRTAWVDAVAWSQDKQQNIIYKPERIDMMLHTAASKGLSEPLGIVRSQLAKKLDRVERMRNEITEALDNIDIYDARRTHDIQTVRDLQIHKDVQEHNRAQALLDCPEAQRLLTGGANVRMDTSEHATPSRAAAPRPRRILSPPSGEPHQAGDDDDAEYKEIAVSSSRRRSHRSLRPYLQLTDAAPDDDGDHSIRRASRKRAPPQPPDFNMDEIVYDNE
jgi:uncharacterized protein (UPF0335 family)